MKDLYVIRHGIADEAEDHGGSDARRQLTTKGADKVRHVAKYLVSTGVKFDLVLASPLIRAVETADIVLRHCAPGQPLATTDLLLPEGSYDELITYLNRNEADRIAIVGHEPMLSGFVSHCLCGGGRPFVSMKKAGVALLRYEETLAPGTCELGWLMGPGQMSPED